MVKDMQISIKDASQALGINYSTAKTILQLFRRSGRIDRLERKYLLSLAMGTNEMGLTLFPGSYIQFQPQLDNGNRCSNVFNMASIETAKEYGRDMMNLTTTFNSLEPSPVNRNQMPQYTSGNFEDEMISQMNNNINFMREIKKICINQENADVETENISNFFVFETYKDQINVRLAKS